jgi:hypothetical protein
MGGAGALRAARLIRESWLRISSFQARLLMIALSRRLDGGRVFARGVTS